MADWKLAVSASAPTVIIKDISSYIIPNTSTFSPIDVFYNSRTALLRAITPKYANSNPTIPPLVLVGLISCTENYFREIMAGILSLCPKAKEKSAEKTVNIATAWFGYRELEKGVFENTSFSDVKNVEKNFKNLGYNFPSSSQISTPLNEFGKLCELRHAIVHSAGLLSGKNAIKLQLKSSKTSAKITMGYSELQESADICTSLVCAVNLELFVHISRRWLHDWPKTDAYCTANQSELFKKVWKLFFSEFDSRNGLIKDPLTLVKTKNQIIKTRGT